MAPKHPPLPPSPLLPPLCDAAFITILSSLFLYFFYVVVVLSTVWTPYRTDPPTQTSTHSDPHPARPPPCQTPTHSDLHPARPPLTQTSTRHPTSRAPGLVSFRPVMGRWRSWVFPFTTCQKGSETPRTSSCPPPCRTPPMSHQVTLISLATPPSCLKRSQ